MPVVGVITCEILELEFAYLLSMDQEIAGITVVEDSYSSGLLQSLKSLGRLEPRMTPLLNGFSPAFAGRMEVLVRVLELGLHNSKDLLQNGLGKAVREMARYVDGIFLGYGLCGNALQNPEELFADAGVPIFFPRDDDHTVDDCVGLIIGGRERYYEEQCKEAGTFFMIPGMTRHWRPLFDEEIGKWSPQIAKRIFRSYKRSLLLPTPVLSEKEMKQNIEDFNTLFNLYTESQSGTLNLLQGAWEGAKKALQRTVSSGQ